MYHFLKMSSAHFEMVGHAVHLSCGHVFSDIHSLSEGRNFAIFFGITLYKAFYVAHFCMKFIS